MAGRITQDVVEVFIEPSTQKGLVTQNVIEAFVQPSTTKARLSQTVLEVYILEDASTTGRKEMPRGILRGVT